VIMWGSPTLGRAIKMLILLRNTWMFGQISVYSVAQCCWHKINHCRSYCNWLIASLCIRMPSWVCTIITSCFNSFYWLL
jgi:hypothetical protein